MSRLYYSTAQLRENSKLTDYPAGVQTYGHQIAVVGIATKGCRITYEVSKQCKQVEDYLYLSCDEDDVVNLPSTEKKILFQMPAVIERTPSRVRGAVSPQLDQLRKALRGTQLVFVVSGLGGTIGSGIAPLVAKCARQVHALVIGVVVMPLIIERNRHFFAGCALRQLTENCDGIILLENELVKGSKEPAVDVAARRYERLALLINSLVTPIPPDGLGTGVENVVDYIRANPYSVLHTSEEAQETPLPAVTESANTSGVLVSYQSREDVNRIINSYDPLDVSLRRSGLENLDPDLDSSLELGHGILRNIEG
jgi:Tubulin/FtsZ family, GTPase domain